MRRSSASAVAPASVGNVGVGFDSLGLSFAVAFDRVRVARRDAPGVALGRVTGLVRSLPEAEDKNTALRAAGAVLRAADADFGLRVDIDKGAPISAGMGGSAASAVAAALAANALLEKPFTIDELLPLAIEGEAASSENPPWDNVAASLYGGLVLVAPGAAPTIVRLPLPKNISCVLVRPHLEAETRAGRAVLPDRVEFQMAVEHGKLLANFVAACFRSDIAALRASMKDVLAEPARAPRFPWFRGVQRAAYDAGALGCSLSGSGPSVFAWARESDVAILRDSMTAQLTWAGVNFDIYESPLSDVGAQLETV